MDTGELLQIEDTSAGKPIALWADAHEWQGTRPIGFLSIGELVVYAGIATRVTGTTFIHILSSKGVGWVVRDVVSRVRWKSRHV